MDEGDQSDVFLNEKSSSSSFDVQKPHDRSDDDNLSMSDDSKSKKSSVAYPLETFPNWNRSGERYYVEAPIDRLGMFAFHLRTHITSLILAGNPAISFLQQTRTDRLTIAAVCFSWLGLETFLFALVTSQVNTALPVTDKSNR